MAISSRTRKILWGRSGARCAICMTNLVPEKTDVSDHFVLGEECHIISSQPGGPRHESLNGLDYDDYENLVLLCCNDHRKIDTQVADYPVEKLITIKKNHEAKIRLATESNRDSEEDDDFLIRIQSGKELVHIIDSVHAYQMDHDEPANAEEASLIACFLENMHDYGDLMGMGEFDPGRKVTLGLEFKKMIDELEAADFWIFGKRLKQRMYSDGKDLGIWDVAALRVVRPSNATIVKVRLT